MSIYHMYFSGMYESYAWTDPEAPPVELSEQQKLEEEACGYPLYPRTATAITNHWATLQEHLEKSDDTFIFIITLRQWDQWETRKKDYELEKYVLFEMPYFVSNRRYPDSGRKLRLVILKGKGNAEVQAGV